MPGKKWSQDEERKLLGDYESRPAGMDIHNFCKAWGKANGRTVAQTEFKLRRMVDANKDETDKEVSSYEQGDDFINIIVSSPRMLTVEQVLKQSKVDTSIWRVDKYKVKTSEGYRKDRQVEWRVVDGVVEYGKVHDTGKMLVVPLFHYEVSLVRKVQEIRAALAIKDMLKDAATDMPRFKTQPFKESKDGLLYEIAIPDIHFGRLTWEEETGFDYDVKIATQLVTKTISKLLDNIGRYKINRILFPFGNDFYNVNSKTNTTVAGTPQQEDTRWQKTFRLGRMLATSIIDLCAQVAPVDVMIVPGNHDEEKTFYLGDALDCWYHNTKRVTINNGAKSRKYYLYGKVLLGFTHGDAIKTDRLVQLMPIENPDEWAQSEYREWHIGHIHHQKSLALLSDEGDGVMVRALRSLVPADAWTFNHGFVGKRGAEAFLWHPERGLIAQFTAFS